MQQCFLPRLQSGKFVDERRKSVSVDFSSIVQLSDHGLGPPLNARCVYSMRVRLMIKTAQRSELPFFNVVSDKIFARKFGERFSALCNVFGSARGGFVSKFACKPSHFKNSRVKVNSQSISEVLVTPHPRK